jgi:hypothetical protein
LDAGREVGVAGAAAAPALALKVHQRALRGDVEVAAAVRLAELDLVCNVKLFAGELQRRGVEGLREDRRVSVKYDVARREDGIGLGGHEFRLVFRAERSDVDPAIRGSRRPAQIQVVLSVGQERRPVVTGFVFVECRGGFRFSALRRDTEQTLFGTK